MQLTVSPRFCSRALPDDTHEEDSQDPQFHSEAKSVTGRRLLEAHGFRAQIFIDDHVDPAIHHYVVTRRDSVEILGWGQERSAEEAETAARNCIEELSRRQSAAG